MEFDKAEKISRPNEYRVNAERIPWGPAAHARSDLEAAEVRPGNQRVRVPVESETGTAAI